jgi:hypothetical protein
MFENHPQVRSCNRYGGDILTIIGTNFGPPQPEARILVGGKTCRTRSSDHTMLVCVLPRGTFTNNQLIIVQGTGRMYVSPVDSYSLSYHQCPVGQAFNTSNIYDCLVCPIGRFSSTAETPWPCPVCPVGYIGSLRFSLSPPKSLVTLAKRCLLATAPRTQWILQTACVMIIFSSLVFTLLDAPTCTCTFHQ